MKKFVTILFGVIATLLSNCVAGNYLPLSIDTGTGQVKPSKAAVTLMSTNGNYRLVGTNTFAGGTNTFETDTYFWDDIIMKSGKHLYLEETGIIGWEVNGAKIQFTVVSGGGGASLDMNDSKITTLGAPVAPADAVNLLTMQNATNTTYKNSTNVMTDYVTSGDNILRGDDAINSNDLVNLQTLNTFSSGDLDFWFYAQSISAGTYMMSNTAPTGLTAVTLVYTNPVANDYIFTFLADSNTVGLFAQGRGWVEAQMRQTVGNGAVVKWEGYITNTVLGEMLEYAETAESITLKNTFPDGNQTMAFYAPSNRVMIPDEEVLVRCKVVTAPAAGNIELRVQGRYLSDAHFNGKTISSLSEVTWVDLNNATNITHKNATNDANLYNKFHYWTNDESIAVGSAASTGAASIAIGPTSHASTNSTAIGSGANAYSINSVAIGDTALAYSNSSTLGYYAQSYGVAGIAIGNHAMNGAVSKLTQGWHNVVIGAMTDEEYDGAGTAPAVAYNFTNTTMIGCAAAISNGYFHYWGIPVVDTNGYMWGSLIVPQTNAVKATIAGWTNVLTTNTLLWGTNADWYTGAGLLARNGNYLYWTSPPTAGAGAGDVIAAANNRFTGTNTVVGTNTFQGTQSFDRIVMIGNGDMGGYSWTNLDMTPTLDDQAVPMAYVTNLNRGVSNSLVAYVIAAVSNPPRYSCMAALIGTNLNLTASTNYKLYCSNVLEDVGGCYDVANGWICPPATGLWTFTAAAYFTGVDVGVSARVRLLHSPSAATTNGYNMFVTGSSDGESGMPAITRTLWINATNEHVFMAVYHGDAENDVDIMGGTNYSGNLFNVLPLTYISGARVGGW